MLVHLISAALLVAGVIYHRKRVNKLNETVTEKDAIIAALQMHCDAVSKKRDLLVQELSTLNNQKTGEIYSKVAILSKSDIADNLRGIPTNNSNLSKSVDSILAEQEAAQQFDWRGYDSEEQKQKVLEKLYTLRSKVSEKFLPNSKEGMTVMMCIKYVSDGYGLTPSITDYLNQINKNV